MLRRVEGRGGVRRIVEECRGVCRSVEGCGGVWRGVEGSAGRSVGYVLEAHRPPSCSASSSLLVPLCHTLPLHTRLLRSVPLSHTRLSRGANVLRPAATSTLSLLRSTDWGVLSPPAVLQLSHLTQGDTEP